MLLLTGSVDGTAFDNIKLEFSGRFCLRFKAFTAFEFLFRLNGFLTFWKLSLSPPTGIFSHRVNT